MPERWKNSSILKNGIERFETTIVGEFDFSEANRQARGKVNLVRVNRNWIINEEYDIAYQEKLENVFERWVRENIADFKEEERYNYEKEQETALKLKQTDIDLLIERYEEDKENLRKAFEIIGTLDSDIIKMFGQTKDSMLEIIRKSIKGLKHKYWRIAFDKLDPVKKRMTLATRQSIFDRIREFEKLDFNADNIYSIVIWIINNTNFSITEQVCEVFDKMTNKEYIEEYKSNRHWAKGDWKYTQSDWMRDELPDRWKLGLDYRIVLHTYFMKYDKLTIVDDFIIICNNLGFPIQENCEPDYTLHNAKQEFYTTSGELAFTMRYYTGNQNAHLKINKKILIKFNVQVAKIRQWLSTPEAIVDDFDVDLDEAVQLWKSSVNLLGMNDVKMLEMTG
jgi:NACalpha-BTF3-like transcription factor